MSKLGDESTNQTLILDQVKRRTDWQRHQEAQKRREEEEAERERVSYAQIDWHDFVVVETVDYQPFEMGNFPPPTTPEEVGARILLQERFEEGQDVEMQLESDSEGGSEDEGDSGDEDAGGRSGARAMPPPPPGAPPGAKDVVQPPLPPTPENVIVRKDYNPKAAPKPQARPPAPDEYLISPITGERSPASKVAEHMRIGLLDPRWVEQRDRQLQEKMTQESVYAPGSAIESSLRQLAERRTDIFGVGDEETAIGKKIGEEERRKDAEKAPWETATPSATDAAGRSTRSGVSLQDQIALIHKNKGLVPDDQRSGANAEEDDEDRRGGGAGVVVAAPPKPPAPPSQSSVAVSASPVMNIPRPLSSQVLLSAPQTHPPLMMVPIPQPPILVAPAPPFGAQGFVPQSSVGMVSSMGMGMAVQHGMGGGAVDAMGDDEPPYKRLRNEDHLMSEEAFLVRYPGLLTFHVATPAASDKAEWKLTGQQLSFQMPPTDSIGTVKAKIHELTGMPPAKQKLFWEGLYFKDTNSLAFYNVIPDAVIQLQVKERGGRKK